MSDPFNPYYRGAFAGGDSAPPPRYSDFEVDLIASRYTGTEPPYPSSADVGAFDSHLGARRSAEGESGPLPVLVGMRSFPVCSSGNAAVF